MINLKIDPEFQSQIPPLTDDEFKQLEENILKEGKLLSPLIVWGNTLVDGHNRYAIPQKHPEIYFSTMPLPFESREEVLAWICKNQLGRRNLTPEQKYYLMGKQYEAEKAAHGGDRKSSDAKSSSLKANLIDNSKTCDRIAEENGVSKDTVIRASKYMKGVEIAEELMPGLKQSILSGQTKVSKADMHRLARAAYNDRAQTLQDILHPELKAEPTPDADGVIRVPGKAPVMPFRKFESVYDSDAYPEDVRYEYVALEELTTRGLSLIGIDQSGHAQERVGAGVRVLALDGQHHDRLAFQLGVSCAGIGGLTEREAGNELRLGLVKEHLGREVHSESGGSGLVGAGEEADGVAGNADGLDGLFSGDLHGGKSVLLDEALLDLSGKVADGGLGRKFLGHSSVLP